jgi:Tfp pilus assembly protein PilX
MNKETGAMRRPDPTRRGERGQILILFVLAIFVIVGVIGIVLDGGAAYAQRREEQAVADLAAVAGATAFLNQSGDTFTKNAAADAAARSIATQNGYTHAVDGAVVEVAIANSSTATNVEVGITGKHRNNFAAILGMPTWDVSVTATARSSDSPNGAIGLMPMLFNAKAFPKAVCDEETGGCTPEIYQLPGTGSEDVPQDATSFNWTVFCASGGGSECNGDSDDVRDINDDIGPLNAGTHTTLLDSSSGGPSLADHIGEAFPVPIVTDDGNMVGLAYFRLVDVEGAPDKIIRGYFLSGYNGEDLVVSPTGGDSVLPTGTFSIKLIN